MHYSECYEKIYQKEQQRELEKRELEEFITKELSLEDKVEILFRRHFLNALSNYELSHMADNLKEDKNI